MGFFNRAAGGMMSAPGGMMGARGSGGLGSMMGQMMRRPKMMPAPLMPPPAMGAPGMMPPPGAPAPEPMVNAPPQLPPGLEKFGGGMSPVKGQGLQELFARMQAGRR